MMNEFDLRTLWKELDEYVVELDKEAKSLQEVWVKIAQIKAKNETEANELMRNLEYSFIPEETIVVLNIGGQIFETTCTVLTKDPYSLLAACCRKTPIMERNEEGMFYFDRDWWLFRHIISFLNSNALPCEIETLKELYTEASYYRLESLQKAIEAIPLSSIQNLTPQITSTWPGLMDGGPNPLRRPQDSYVFDAALFPNL